MNQNNQLARHQNGHIAGGRNAVILQRIANQLSNFAGILVNPVVLNQALELAGRVREGFSQALQRLVDYNDEQAARVAEFYRQSGYLQHLAERHRVSEQLRNNIRQDNMLWDVHNPQSEMVPTTTPSTTAPVSRHPGLVGTTDELGMSLFNLHGCLSTSCSSC